MKTYPYVGMLAVSLLSVACGGPAPPAQSASADACDPGRVLPVGRWNATWSSFALQRSSHVLQGSADLVVAENGKVSGSVIDDVSLANGTVTGTVEPGGEFKINYAVRYKDRSQDYDITGTFACSEGAIDGHGAVSWHRDDHAETGSMEFRLTRRQPAQP